jgi:hypothetical protein
VNLACEEARFIFFNTNLREGFQMYYRFILAVFLLFGTLNITTPAGAVATMWIGTSEHASKEMCPDGENLHIRSWDLRTADAYYKCRVDGGENDLCVAKFLLVPKVGKKPWDERLFEYECSKQ